MSTSSSSPARFVAFLATWLAMGWILATAVAYNLDAIGLRRASGDVAPIGCGEQICAAWRLWKPVAFARSGARTVLLGSSRVALGMDPADIAGGTAFNLAFEGPDFGEVSALAVNLMQERRADHVIVGLDRVMFSRATASVTRLPDEQPTKLSNAVAYATSRLALRRVGGIIRSGRCCGAMAGRAADGCVSVLPMGTAPFGPAADREIDIWVMRYATPCAGPGCAAANYTRNLEALRVLTATAARTHTRLTLFLNPLPAAHLELQWRVARAPDLAQWKRDLAQAVAGAGGGWVAQPRDFAVFSPETAIDTVLTAAANDLQPGFLDYSHYSRGLGRLVMRSLDSEPPAHGFGASLGWGLEQHLEADRIERDHWVQSHAAEVSRIERRKTALKLK